MLRKCDGLFILKMTGSDVDGRAVRLRVAAYPKTVTLRADRRVCSNSLLTAHFVFGFVTVLNFVVLFYARDCPRKFNWSNVCLCICLRNICMRRCLCIGSDHHYLSGGLFMVLPS